MYTHVNIFTKLHLPAGMVSGNSMSCMSFKPTLGRLSGSRSLTLEVWKRMTLRAQRFDGTAWPPVSTDFHDATTDVQHRAHVFTVETCWQRSSSQPHGARL